MTSSVDTPIIDAGLAKYEPDYYATLGVPLNADNRLIRKGYLKTAKQLHPDRFIGEPEKRTIANWLFSKLISPASEVLNREKDRIEYREVLRLRTKRLLALPPDQVWPESHFVDTLLQATDLDTTYSDTILNLAAHQYKDLNKVGVCTEELSKINLAYLLLSSGYKVTTPAQPKVQSKPTYFSNRPRKDLQPIARTPISEQSPRPPQTAASSTPTAPPPGSAQQATTPPPATPAPEVEQTPPENPGEKRYQQAKQMMLRKLYKEALQFLNIAIGAEPNNAQYYYERGLAFLKLSNAPRARQDFQRVLNLDPDHAQAAQKLKSMGQKTSSASPEPARVAAASTKNAPKEKVERKGMFGRLFSR